MCLPVQTQSDHVTKGSDARQEEGEGEDACSFHSCSSLLEFARAATGAAANSTGAACCNVLQCVAVRCSVRVANSRGENLAHTYAEVVQSKIMLANLVKHVTQCTITPPNMSHSVRSHRHIFDGGKNSRTLDKSRARGDN